MTNKDWTSDIRQKLDNHQEKVSDDLWTRIEQSLDSQQPKRKSTVIALRRWAVAAIAIGVVFGAILWWSPSGEKLAESQPGDIEYEFAEDLEQEGEDWLGGNHENVGKDENVGQVGRVRPVRRGGRLLAQNNKKHADTVEKKQADAAENRLADAKENRQADAEVNRQADAEENSRADAEENMIADAHQGKERNDADYFMAENQLADNGKYHSVPEYGYVEGYGYASTPRSMSKQPSIKLYASGNLSSNNTTSLTSNTVYMSGISSYNSMTTSSNAVRTFSNKSSKHRPPLSIGVSYKHPISERLWLSAGATYTRLVSEFSSQAMTTKLVEEQTLHYVGIPITIGFTVWKKGGFSTYSTGGIQTDINVKSTVEANGRRIDSRRDRVQFSALAGIGAEYDFTPNAGIYVEPQMKYYPDNGSSVENYFKENKLGFNLELGLRIIY